MTGTSATAQAGRARRTQAERRAEASQRMLAAAVRLIAEKGLRGLVLSEVAALAGYSATLPVHYYRSKEGLVVLTARTIIEEYNGILREELQGVSGLKYLRTFVRTYMRYTLDHPEKRRALFMITSEAAVDPELKDSIAALGRTGAASIAERIRDGQAAGDIDPVLDPETSATMLLAWMRGAVSLWAIDPDLDLEQLGAAIEAAVVRMFSPPAC